MINVDRIIETLNTNQPHPCTTTDDFIMMCKDIVEDMESQVIPLTESKFEDIMKTLNLEDELTQLRSVCSPDELSLFLLGLE